MATRERTEFGARLVKARDLRQINQKQAAHALGISQSTLSELELVGYGSSHVVAMAKLYGVSPYWLALGEGDMEERERLSEGALEIARAYERMNTSERSKLRMLLVVARDGVDPQHFPEPGPAKAPKP